MHDGICTGFADQMPPGSSMISTFYKHGKELWSVPPLETAFATLAIQIGRKTLVNSAQSKQDQSVGFLAAWKLPLSPALYCKS